MCCSSGLGTIKCPTAGVSAPTPPSLPLSTHRCRVTAVRPSTPGFLSAGSVIRSCPRRCRNVRCHNAPCIRDHQRDRLFDVQRERPKGGPTARGRVNAKLQASEWSILGNSHSGKCALHYQGLFKQRGDYGMVHKGPIYSPPDQRTEGWTRALRSLLSGPGRVKIFFVLFVVLCGRRGEREWK